MDDTLRGTESQKRLDSLEEPLVLGDKLCPCGDIGCRRRALSGNNCCFKPRAKVRAIAGRFIRGAARHGNRAKDTEVE